MGRNPAEKGSVGAISLGDLTRVEISGGIQASLAGRYAVALFQLARDAGQIDSVDASVAKLKQALAESADLRLLTTSPQIGREDAGKAIAAVAGVLGLDTLTTNFLGVLARNGRLFQLGAAIKAYTAIVANHRGEITATVTSAHPLNDEQIDALKTKLRGRLGREVAVDLHVDPAILGGLIVKTGSQQIDGSIRTKLNTLANAMKG